MNRLTRLFSTRAGDAAVVQVQGAVRLDHHATVVRHTDAEDGRYRRVAAVPPGASFAPALLPQCLVTTSDLMG